MKFNRIKSLLVLMLISFLTFTSCEDEKKEKEAVMEAEKIEEAAEKAEADKLEAEKMAKAEEMKMEARNNSVSARATANEELKTLTAGLKAAELDVMLSEPGNYTVFAPSENAFSKLPKGELDRLLMEENKDELKGILQYHVVSGKITSDKLVTAIKGGKGKYTFNTVTGQPLTAMMDGTQIVIEDSRGRKAHVIQGNVDASNGMVHIIDNVLMAKK